MARIPKLAGENEPRNPVDREHAVSASSTPNPARIHNRLPPSPQLGVARVRPVLHKLDDDTTPRAILRVRRPSHEHIAIELALTLHRNKRELRRTRTQRPPLRLGLHHQRPARVAPLLPIRPTHELPIAPLTALHEGTPQEPHESGCIFRGEILKVCGWGLDLCLKKAPVTVPDLRTREDGIWTVSRCPRYRL